MPEKLRWTKSLVNSRLQNKDSDKKEIAGAIANHPDWLSDVFHGLESPTPAVKYGCDKVLRILSAEAPELLSEQFDFFVKNLSHENNFLKWGATHVIANIAGEITTDRIADILDEYFQPVTGESLPAASNVLKGAPTLARAHPKLADAIAVKCLKIDGARFPKPVCFEMATGQTIDSLGQFFDLILNQGPVVEFVRQHLEHPRNATRKKAEAFWKAYQ